MVLEHRDLLPTPQPLGELVRGLIAQRDLQYSGTPIAQINEVLTHSNGKDEQTVEQADIDAVAAVLQTLKSWEDDNSTAPQEMSSYINMGRLRSLVFQVDLILNSLQELLSKKTGNPTVVNQETVVPPEADPVALAERWKRGEDLPKSVEGIRNFLRTFELKLTENPIDIAFLRLAPRNESHLIKLMEGMNSTVIAQWDQALKNIAEVPGHPTETAKSDQLNAEREFLIAEREKIQDVINRIRDAWQNNVNALYPSLRLLRDELAKTADDLRNNALLIPSDLFIAVEQYTQRVRTETADLTGWYREEIDRLITPDADNKSKIVEYMKEWLRGRYPVIQQAESVIDGNSVLDSAALTTLAGELRSIGKKHLEQDEFIDHLIQQIDGIIPAKRAAEQLLIDYDASVREIRRAMQLLNQGDSLVITVEDDNVTKRFSSLYDSVNRLKEFDPSRLAETTELELDLTESEYLARRRAYFEGIITVEDNNIPMSDFGGQINTVFKGKILEGMKELVSKFEFSGDTTRLDKYKVDLENVTKDFYTRAGHHEAWVTHKASIYTDGEMRTPPKNVTPSNMPINGKSLEWTINGGLKNPEFGDISNLDLGPRTVDKRSWTTAGDIEQVTFNETAAGFCFRLFDDIYDGREVVIDDAGNQVGTHNIHLETSSNALLAHVLRKLQVKIQSIGEDPDLVSKSFVLRKFREHMMMTLNHSYLAPRSAGVTDEIYYLFHWPEYLFKESSEGTGTFEPFITAMMFGFDPDFKLLEHIAPDRFQQVVTHFENEGYLDDDDHLYHATGIYNFDQLIDAPIITLKNYAEGTRSRGGQPVENILTPFIESPLRYQLVKDYNGDPLRFPTTPDEQADGIPGRLITFDDYQSLDGRRLYELMDFQSAGSWIEYYQDLSKNGLPFLNNYLKVSRDKFLKEMEDPTFVSAFKKSTKYSLKLLPRLGAEIHAGDHMAELKAKTMITIQLVYIKCLLETDTTSAGLAHKKAWVTTDVEHYLDKLLQNNVFSDDLEVSEHIVKAIKDAVTVGGFFKMQRFRFLQSIRAQYEKKHT